MGKKKAAAPKPGPALDEGLRQLNKAAVARLGQKITIETPDFGPLEFYALQPEQISATRARLQSRGWHSAAAISLPAQGHPNYALDRRTLAHLQTTCCRHPETRRLLFPGAEGRQKIERFDDNRLVNMAREIVEFNHIFDKPPEQPPAE